MSKTKLEMPIDMWLHVATDALARYAAGGGKLAIMKLADENGEDELVIYLGGVNIDDPRLSPAFADIHGRFPTVIAQEEQTP